MHLVAARDERQLLRRGDVEGEDQAEDHQDAEQLGPAVDYLAAYQLNCNYIAIASRNLASTVSEGNASGNWLRFAAVIQPSEMFPTANPASDLHFDPYPNAGAPGQPHECEAGNQPYLPGRQLGNAPGDQGTHTEMTSPEQTAAVSK